MVNPQPSTSSSSPRTQFLLALVIAVIAAVVGAFVADILAADSSADEGSHGGRLTPSTQPQQVVPPSGSTALPTPTVPASSPPTGPPAVRFDDRITLQRGATGEEVDLDALPPQVDRDDADNDVLLEYGMRTDEGDLSDFDGSARLVKWDRPTPPDYFQCTNAAVGGIKTVKDVRVDTVLCVRTSEGRTAMLRAIRVEKFNSITFHATIWEK